MQLDSSIALALPDARDAPHAATHAAPLQPLAHARYAAHSEPIAQSFFAESQRPETHDAQPSTLGASAATTPASPASPASIDASVPASSVAQLTLVVRLAIFVHLDAQSLAQEVAQVFASLQDANATYAASDLAPAPESSVLAPSQKHAWRAPSDSPKGLSQLRRRWQPSSLKHTAHGPRHSSSTQVPHAVEPASAVLAS